MKKFKRKLKIIYLHTKHLEWLVRHMIMWFFMMRFDDAYECLQFLHWHIVYRPTPVIEDED